MLQDVKMQPGKHGITEAAHLLGIDNLYDAFIARFEALNKKELDFFELTDIFSLGQ